MLLVVIPFAAALAWRLAYVGRLVSTPLAGTLRGDELSYWDWASYLSSHAFVGTNPFFQGPLYPFVLALIRSALAPSPDQVLFAQAVWGSAAVLLLSDALRRMAGGRVALAIGLVLAVNTMWVFFDSRVLSESLLLFLESLLIWIWSLQATRPHRTLFTVFASLTIGLLAQGRATAAFLLIPQVLLVRGLARSQSRAWRGEALLAVGLFVASALPSTLWNWSRTGAFIPFTYNGGMNLFIGNHERANGQFVWVDGARLLGTARSDAPDGGTEMDGREYLRKEKGLALTERQSSDYWLGLALRWIANHPYESARLAGYKVMLMFNRVESRQLEHVEIFEQLAGPVGAPLVGGFLVLGLLGLAGSLFVARWGVFGRATLGYLVVVVLATAPFFVTDRYRIHILPALAMLAGLSLQTLMDTLRHRGGGANLRSLLSAFAGATLLTCMPLNSTDPKFDRWLGTSDLGLRWMEAGDASRAVRTFREAASIEQQFTPAALADPDVKKDRALLHFNHGVALRRVESNAAALPEWELAARLDPSNPRYLRTLSEAYRLMGREREADSLLRSAALLVGGEAEVAVSEGFRAAREGRMGDATRELERAVAGNARLFGAWGALIRVKVHQGDLPSAGSTLRRAELAGMPSVVATVYEGLLAAKRGDLAAAQRALDATEQAELDPTLEHVRLWTRELVTGKSSPEPAEH